MSYDEDGYDEYDEYDAELVAETCRRCGCWIDDHDSLVFGGGCSCGDCLGWL